MLQSGEYLHICDIRRGSPDILFPRTAIASGARASYLYMSRWQDAGFWFLDRQMVVPFQLTRPQLQPSKPHPLPRDLVTPHRANHSHQPPYIRNLECATRTDHSGSKRRLSLHLSFCRADSSGNCELALSLPIQTEQGPSSGRTALSRDRGLNLTPRCQFILVEDRTNLLRACLLGSKALTKPTQCCKSITI